MAELPGPEPVNNPFIRQNYFDYQNAGTLDVLGATFQDTIHYNPLNSGVRAFDYFVQKDKGRKLTQDEWRRSDFFRPTIEVGQDGIHEGAATMLAQDYDERLRRRIVLDRANPSFGLGASQLGVGFLASALDPLNIASAFIPVVGQARFASMAVRHGVTKARAIRGVAEGAVGAAAVEPIVLGASALLQDDDYTIMDTLLNVTFGSALGGGLHVAGGKLSDRLSRTKLPTREALTRTAVSQLVSDRKVDVEVIAQADPVLRDQQPVLSLGPAAPMNRELKFNPKGRKIPSVLRPALVEKEQPKSLLSFIRSQGKIFTGDKDIGEIKQIFDAGKGGSYFGIVSNNRATAKTLDELTEAAQEAGYIKSEDSVSRATINDLLDALREEKFGNRIYKYEDLEQVVAMERAGQLVDEAEALDIDYRGLTDEQFFSLLSERGSVIKNYEEMANAVPSNISYKVFKEGLTEQEFSDFKNAEISKTYDLQSTRDDFMTSDEIEAEAANYKDPEFDAIQEEIDVLQEQINTLSEVDEVPAEFLEAISAADELVERANSFDAATEAAAVCVGRAVRAS